MPHDTPALPAPPVGLLRDASLFIDFDGTLVELVDRPEDVCVDADLRDLIRRLATALPDRLAIVSGRSIAQLDAFLGPDLAGVALGGSHGMERRHSDSRLEQPKNSVDLGRVASALDAFAADHPGTIVERKTYGVTLHYRLAPGVGPLAEGVARRIAGEYGLQLQPGKMMMELKVRGGDKGDAIAGFMRSPAMAGTRPWFIGDDLTDEPGFVAARNFGGGGIVVGPSRPTAARYMLWDVAAVRGWLVDAADELS